MTFIMALILGMLVGVVVAGILYSVPHAVGAAIEYDNKTYIITEAVPSNDRYLAIKAIEVNINQKGYN